VPEALRLAVREVCIDMDPFYLNTALECFPNAKIVIDKFHVIQWSIQLMEDLRRLLQTIHKKKFKVAGIIKKDPGQLTENEWKRLEECFECYSDLKRSWLIVQEVRLIYRKGNFKKACSQLRKVIWYCEQSDIDQMKQLAGTLRRWKYPILNYYISRTTNAYTEGIHNKFETLRRGHCGIRNVERFAKRLMFCMLPFSIIIQQFAQRF